VNIIKKIKFIYISGSIKIEKDIMKFVKLNRDDMMNGNEYKKYF
jgi:hypothetical protein